MSRDPFAPPSLYSLAASSSHGSATIPYEFQMTIFLEDSNDPIFNQTFSNKNPSKDGTYITTYAVPDHRLWSRPLRVFITDLTSYKGNQPLLRLRLDHIATPGVSNVRSVPFNFQTREFKNIDQRTIKIKLDTVYRMELHFTF